MKRFFVFLLSVFMVLPFGVSAAEFGTGETYTLPKGETLEENLYASGGSVTISGDVNGDVVIAGGDLKVTGAVAEDLMIAGGSLTILGDIGEDLRAGGGSITISSNVGGEVISAGGSLHILDGSVIEGDVVLMGGSLILDGEVRGKVKLTGGQAIINGTILGDVEVLAEDVILSDTADLGGNLTYTSEKEASIAEAASIAGEVTRKKGVRELQVMKSDDLAKAFAGFFKALLLVKFLVVLVTGLLLAWWFKNSSKQLATHALGKMGKNFLTGLIFAIVGPVVIGLLFATVFGWIFAMLALMLYAATMMLSGVYAGIVFGSWLKKVSKKSSKAIVVNWKTVAIGIILLEIAGFIPVLGWIVVMIFFMTALGSMLMLFHERVWKAR